MKLERFSRSIPFELGIRLPRTHLKSADADGKTFQKIVCIRLCRMFFAENLAKFLSTLKSVLSMAYGDTVRSADLTTKLVCVKLALARGECYYTFSALLGDSN